MRYHVIANRQPITGCLFLFYIVLSLSAPSCSSRKFSRISSTSVLIEYVGDQSVAQGDFIQINSHLFWHDSMYVFHKQSPDTIYLPTQRYLADQPSGKRPVYASANAFSSLIGIVEYLSNASDSSKYSLDISRIHSGKLIINSKGSAPVEVIASPDYPLRIIAAKH